MVFNSRTTQIYVNICLVSDENKAAALAEIGRIPVAFFCDRGTTPGKARMTARSVMNVRECQPAYRRDALADLWRNTLSEIESVFGRLVYLSSLRDLNSGCYEHYGLAQVSGEEEADRAIRAAHRASFVEWLSYNLEQQKADLDLYLSTLDVDKRTVLEYWARLAPYRSLVPAEADEVERQLYLCDLEAILALMNNQYGVTRSVSAA